MLLAPATLTFNLTILIRVKECLYLGIDEEEEHGRQQMQGDKQSCMTFISVSVQNGMVTRG